VRALWRDASAPAGLDFFHFNGRSGRRYLAEITCGGGGLVDIDGDDDLDLYLSQGHMLGPGLSVEDAFEPPHHPLPLSDRLYRNDQVEALDGSGTTLRLRDITDTAGIAAATTGYGCGIAAGDLDNDGDLDLLVLTLGANRLLLGRGDGTFVDATEAVGMAGAAERSSVAAVVADFDRDGWLDLFVANNLDFVYDHPEPCFDLAGAPDYCGPGAFRPQQDRLWHSRGLDASGQLRFEDRTDSAGLGDHPGPALGALAADFDGDGWLDLYVANDGQPNFLWHNRGAAAGGGGPHFEDQGLLAGAALNSEGAAEASMGVDAGDYDGDGDLDLFLAHLVKETDTLYRNDGAGHFEDRSRTSGLAAPSLPFTSFGTGFADFNLDGWLDLVVVNGAVTRLPALARAGDPFPLHQPNQWFLGRGLVNGEARFADATSLAGPDFARSEVSRGALLGDLDQDGDIDLVVVNNGGPARLLLNQSAGRSGWLGLRLVGETRAGARFPVRDLPGACARIDGPGNRQQMACAHTDGSYNASRDPRVVFGLGERYESEYSVRVTWPDGSAERFDHIAADRYTRLRRGSGTALAP